MAKKSWSFTLDGVPHKVALTHGYLSGKRAISVDGRPLAIAPQLARQRIDYGSKHPFHIGYHEGLVFIRTKGLTFTYDLAIDGRSVDSGLTVDPESPTHSITRESFDRAVLLPFLVLFGFISIGANWYLARRYGLYLEELAFLGPALLVLAGYVALFGDDLRHLPKRIPNRAWAAIALAIAAGAANSYALSHGLY